MTMQVIREIIKADADKIMISVPKSFRNREIEVLLIPFEEKSKNKAFRTKTNFSKIVDGLSWNMGIRLYSSREDLNARK